MLQKIKENPNLEIPPNALDLVRLSIAGVIAIAHFLELQGTEEYVAASYWIQGNFLVYAFFSLSGFLVSPSLVRSSSLKSYFIKRMRRLYPGYIAMILLVVIGLAWISTLPFSEYFTSKDTFRYLFFNLTFLNFLEPHLPGVFMDAPRERAVNGALWTMKVEVCFYIFLPFLLWGLGYVRRAKLRNIILVGLYVLALLYLVFIENSSIVPEHLRHSLSHQFPGLLHAFTAGIFIFFNFDWYKRNMRWLAVVGLILLSERFLFGTMYVAPLGLAFLAFFVGFGIPRLLRFSPRFDISFGVYVYHIPVIQTLIALGVPQYSMWLAFVLMVVFVTLLAFLSWHLIEKRFVKRKLGSKQMK